MVSMGQLFVVLILFSCFKRSASRTRCVGTCYSGRLFPETKYITHGKRLKGYSYNNITTDDPAKCYHQCVQDCRCKACQMKDGRCELLDEDKTSKASNIITETGYVYFDLKQTLYQGRSPIVPPGGCYNGCCQSQPCLNGGTCVEQCSTPKEKFICKCKHNFNGKVCENSIIYSSCKDVYSRWNSRQESKPVKGVHLIRRSVNKTMYVYCAFNFQNNRTWTLIESFALKNNYLFADKPFYLDFDVNQDSPPNWNSYRLSLDNMQYFRSKSTMFRATCNFPIEKNFKVDSLNGNLSEVDIINEKDIESCKRYTTIFVTGKKCFRCSAFTFHGKKYNWHFHLDVTKGHCDFNHSYDTKGAHSFGFYNITERKSRCTETSKSTTQWWLGEEQ